MSLVSWTERSAHVRRRPAGGRKRKHCLTCCQNEVSDALFWLEGTILYTTVLNGGPTSVHCKLCHLSRFVNSDLKKKKEKKRKRGRNCIIFNRHLPVGFLCGRWENSEMPDDKKVQDVNRVLKNHRATKYLASVGGSKKVKVPCMADSRRCLG